MNPIIIIILLVIFFFVCLNADIPEETVDESEKISTVSSSSSSAQESRESAENVEPSPETAEHGGGSEVTDTEGNMEPEEGTGGRERAGEKQGELPVAPHSDWLNKKRAGEPCEFGLEECISNAACVIREGSRSRQGHCRCEDGFRKSPDGSRFCVAFEGEGRS